MRLPTLFKQRSAKGYNYTPRYYDERKERLEELKKNKEGKSNEDYFKGYRRKSYREDWKSTRKSPVDSNYRLRFIVILILLLMFAVVAVRYINLDTLF